MSDKPKNAPRPRRQTQAEKKATERRKAEDIRREYRRTRVAAMYARGRTFPEIAKELDCAYRTVQNDMGVIRERWRETYVSEFAKGIVDELGKLEEVYREAWDAWEASKNDTVTTEEGANDKGGWHKAKRVSNAGNPRFLDILTEITVKRMQALGMIFDAKRKQEEKRGNYGQGYEVLTVVVKDRRQAQEVMGLEQFRHQFVGYDSGEEAELSASDLIAKQVAVLEPAPQGNGNGKHQTKNGDQHGNK